MKKKFYRSGIKTWNVVFMLLLFFWVATNLKGQIDQNQGIPEWSKKQNTETITVIDPSVINPNYDLQKLQNIQILPDALLNNTRFNNKRMDLSRQDGSLDNSMDLTTSDCFIPLDASYIAVPRNDDGSFGPISLPFTFSLYGTYYNEVFINTNGNLTFTGPVWTFSPFGFPYSVPMVAPFWGDVDTRNTGAGQIYYKINPTNMIITWDDVGYYNQHIDKRNTFQVVIGTNLDELTGIGQNVCFYYEDMQWTTGDASGGSGGFGGIPSTVGINHGNGTDFVQVGRFNLNNYNYDGPGGANDGVHYLDYKCWCFSVSNSGNIPPAAANFPSGNILYIDCEETVTLTLDFIPPEVNQNVFTAVNTGGLCNTSYTISSGSVSTVTLTITGSSCNQGTHTISFTATDNGDPQETTVVNLTVVIEGECCDPPDANCKNKTVYLNSDGEATITTADINNNSTYECGLQGMSLSKIFFDCDDVGENTVTLTVTDDNGETDECTATVTVLDNIDPVINCPDPITVNNDPGDCGANVIFSVSASDNCPGVTYICTTGSGVMPGNCAVNEINLSITFDDYPEETSWMITNSGGTIVQSGGPYGAEPGGSTLNLSFNLPDDSYKFTIKDSFGDGICCTYGYGSYTLLSGNGDIIASGGDFSSSSMTPFCVETPEEYSSMVVVSSGDFFPVGTTTVTCTATDASGNTDICSFDINVIDNEAPVIDTPCPTAISLCGAQNVSWTPPTATDNCGIISSSSNYDPGDYFSVGSHTVTYTFYDAAELSVSCSFVVTIHPLPTVEITQSNLPVWCQGIKVLTAKVNNPGALSYPLTYAWSDGLGGNPMVIAPANGTYSVTVTDALGCYSVASTIVNVDISTLLSAYTIIAGKGLEMHESTVLSGGVGVLNADEVTIQNNTDIATFLRSANAYIDGSSTVANYINSNAPIMLPPFLPNNFNDYNNVYVPSGGSMTLSGNHYGNVTVGKNATLTIDNGSIYLKSLKMNTASTLIFNQSTNMMVKKKVTIGMLCNVNVEGPTTVIYSSDRASVGQGSNIGANIYAPEGLEANDSGSSLTTYMIGLFIGNDEVSSGDNVVWGWNLNCSYMISYGQDDSFASQDSQGIEANLVQKQGLHIYPNPTDGLLNVSVGDYKGKAIDITIYDQLGRMVWTQHNDEIQNAVIQVDLSTGVFHNSLYLLSLQSEGKIISKLFILDK